MSALMRRGIRPGMLKMILWVDKCVSDCQRRCEKVEVDQTNECMEKLETVFDKAVS
jgi:hypothetical protein